MELILHISDPRANVFYLMGDTRREMQKRYTKNDIEDMKKRVTSCSSYEEAIKIMNEYRPDGHIQIIY